MVSKTKYSGIIPAFYACYDDAGEISKNRTQALARHLLTNGVQGLYVNGSSGECIYLSVDERKKVLDAVMEAVGGKMTVIAHVACNNTKDSMELAKHAQEAGVDAIAAIPPIYFHLPDAAIAAYWNDISSAAPKTDFIIYNIPQLAGVSLTPALFVQMLQNPLVKGVKNSSISVQDIRAWKDLGGERIAVLNGPDEQYIAGRMMGADGGIGGTYAVMPSLFLKAEALISNGEVEKARAVQKDICEMIAALCSCRGNMYAVAKEVLRRNKGLQLGGVRAPLPPLQSEDHEKVKLCAELLLACEEKLLSL